MSDVDDEPSVDLLAERLGAPQGAEVRAILEHHDLAVLDAADLARLRKIERAYQRLAALVTAPDDLAT
ncbi:hypothetical protein KSP35_13265 [Aquihabitans sp. G128]|uniref:hypothetical protein n=1 Tax=Aquihabitans sp. G128 TaxID=2849779 RepID=UPI001C21A79A|nr:hypothetical protein [Aquihabitans sp. G128]QXC59372.1 hypothetical protein KSP35_13265 [Aquihabitans sp. G128]